MSKWDLSAVSSRFIADRRRSSRHAVRSSAASAPSGPARPDWREIDWNAHQRWVKIDGRQINLVELGDGSPIIFIHGLSGCWQNWLENIPAAARHHRVVAVDLPGFGASQTPRLPISIPGYAETFVSLCHALEIDTATVVGNSMGGFIAAELAISHPPLLDRLVLVDAAGLSTEEMHRRPLYTLAHLARSSGFSQLTATPAVAKRPGLRRLALGLVARHPERFSADLSRAILAGGGKDASPEALAFLSHHSIRDRLNQIRSPTLIIWGENDRLVPVADAFELKSLIPDAQLIVFPDTGHVSMIERPERFNAALAEFTSQTS